MDSSTPERLSTGLAGLDEITHGGLLAGRTYLATGGAGTGKTTLGLHFLAAGLAAGEAGLLVSLNEAEGQLREDAARRGLDLEGVEILDLSPTSDFFEETEGYELFRTHRADTSLLMKRLRAALEGRQPRRVLFDSVTQLRLAVADAYRYRQHLAALSRFLVGSGATTLMLAEAAAGDGDALDQFVVDGVLQLERRGEDRKLAVTKFRGSGFEAGAHSFRLGARGMEIFPRLVPDHHLVENPIETVSTGHAALDEVMGGGYERGIVMAISGPSGVGKSTLAMTLVAGVAARGERAMFYCFDEGPATLKMRCRALGIPVDAMIEDEHFRAEWVEPVRYSADELATQVRHQVEALGARLVVIDSVRGYSVALADDSVAHHLHSLCRYLRNMGVTTLLINEHEDILGSFKGTGMGLSYLADSMMFLSYQLEGGLLGRAVGMLKRRTGPFAPGLRDFRIVPGEGIVIGGARFHKPGSLGEREHAESVSGADA